MRIIKLMYSVLHRIMQIKMMLKIINSFPKNIYMKQIENLNDKTRCGAV